MPLEAGARLVVRLAALCSRARIVSAAHPESAVSMQTQLPQAQREYTNGYSPQSAPARSRWLTLIVLSLGASMIALDATIVFVALPTIRADLAFSEASLSWVVNAYSLTFGGLLLLGARLGDLFGHRRLFLLGVLLFTLASLICGLSTSQATLIGARALQGVGGAVVSAVALSLAVGLFEDQRGRAKAMAVLSFANVGAGSIGFVLGGTLTSAVNWHWIFLINIPVECVVFGLSLALLKKDSNPHTTGHLDIAGALAVTAFLIVALYAITSYPESERPIEKSLPLLVIAIALLTVFLTIEARVRVPLVPLRFFVARNLAVANVVYMLLTPALYAAFFTTTLYLQAVLQYSPFQVGFAFLAINPIAAAFTLVLAPRLVMWFGIKPPLTIGLLLAACGLALLAVVPIRGTFSVDVLPGMTLASLGVAMATTPLMLAAMNDIEPEASGLASGLVSTASSIGGALGLAVVASLAAARTKGLQALGFDNLTALNGGCHLAYLICCALMLLAALVSAQSLRPDGNPSMTCAARP